MMTFSSLRAWSTSDQGGPARRWERRSWAAVWTCSTLGWSTSRGASQQSVPSRGWTETWWWWVSHQAILRDTHWLFCSYRRITRAECRPAWSVWRCLTGTDSPPSLLSTSSTPPHRPPLLPPGGPNQHQHHRQPPVINPPVSGDFSSRKLRRPTLWDQWETTPPPTVAGDLPVVIMRLRITS